MPLRMAHPVPVHIEGDCLTECCILLKRALSLRRVPLHPWCRFRQYTLLLSGRGGQRHSGFPFPISPHGLHATGGRELTVGGWGVPNKDEEEGYNGNVHGPALPQKFPACVHAYQASSSQ